MTVVAERLKMLGHPVRIEILQALRAGPASPSAIARETGVSLGNVAYHVRALAKSGLIVPTTERPVRGSVEHFYELAPAASRAFAALEAMSVESPGAGR